MLEERDRQAAPQPRAASQSAAAFPFARGVSALVSDGVQEIEHHFSALLWRVDTSNDPIVDRVANSLTQ